MKKQRLNHSGDQPYSYYKNSHSKKVSKFIQDDEHLDLDNKQSIKDAKIMDKFNEVFAKKQTFKPQSVSLRKDVVNKAIFRGLNKFYNKMFGCKTNYRGKSKDALYNKFTSRVTELFHSYQINANLDSQQNNGKIGQR